MKSNYTIPPYKIKMVEPIRLISKEDRIQRLKEAGYNPFKLRSEDVFIDLLTDSGTGAMSHFQWAALMQGDESYAGSTSFYKLESVVKDITGYKYVMPAHQGRGAEQVVIPLLLKRPNMIFLSNTHFDTTRAHVEIAGGIALDVACKESTETLALSVKGNFDHERLEELILHHRKENIAGIILTVTNNSVGGQPVSMDNIKKVHQIAKRYDVKIIIDGARYAENSYFIKQREAGYENHTLQAIARELFSMRCFLMSAKKDGLVNIGGLIAIKDDEELFRQSQTRIVPMEGFPTYGGLAGRDMEALAVGLKEALDESYQAYRIDEIRFLGDLLVKGGVPIQYPTGGHAVFVDCGLMCPQIPFDEFPAQAVTNELYIEGGVRAVEIGSLLLGRDPQTYQNRKADQEFMRLTIPRRTYTFQHLQYVAECLINVYQRRDQIKGLTFDYESPILRHFTSTFKPVK
jgi:tryptophanase